MQNILPPRLLLRYPVPLTTDIHSYIDLSIESNDNLQLVSSIDSSNNHSSKSNNNPSSKSNKALLHASVSKSMYKS